MVQRFTLDLGRDEKFEFRDRDGEDDEERKRLRARFIGEIEYDEKNC